MVPAPHQDRGGLAAPAEGTLYEGRAAAVHYSGNPLRYPTGPEYRDPDELARLSEQLADKPVTLLHPGGLIRDGVPAKVIGRVVTSRLEDGHAVASILITDPAGISAISGGTHELSVGYSCSLDDRRKQKGIDVDHLALVPKGRCTSCVLRADSSTRFDCDGVYAQKDAVSEGACECKNHAVDSGIPVDPNIIPTQIPVTGTTVLDAKLNAKERNALPAHSFGIPGRKGLPLEDAAHVRDAMARFEQEHFTSSAEERGAYHRVLARAHELGIDATGFKKAHMKLDDDTGSAVSEDSAEMTGAAAPDMHAKIVEALSKPYFDRAEKAEKERDDAKAAMDAAVKERDDAKKALDEAVKERDDAKVALDAAKKDAKTNYEEVDAAKEREDALKVKLDAANAALKTRLDAELLSQVATKVELLSQAAQIGAEVNAKMSDRDIKVTVIKHLDGEVPADARDAFVDGMYANAIKHAAKVAGSVAAARQAINKTRQDGIVPTLSGRDAEKQAQEAMIDRANKAYTGSKK